MRIHFKRYEILLGFTFEFCLCVGFKNIKNERIAYVTWNENNYEIVNGSGTNTITSDFVASGYLKDHINKTG